MTARTLLTAMALFGLVGSAVAQTENPTPAPTAPAQTDKPQTPADPTPTPADRPQTAPAPSPSVQSLGTQPQPTPIITSSGVVYPNQGMVYPGGVVQSGYAQPMTYSPQGQIMPAGYAQPGVVSYGTPSMSGAPYGYTGTGYQSYGSSYPVSGIYPTAGVNYPGYGTTGVGTGYAYPSFANGYANMNSYSGGTVGNVVTAPTRAARRLFRR